MTEQQKILRVFKLISYLSKKPYYTQAQLAQKLDVDKRTIRRYFNLLEELGYQIDHKDGHRFFVQIEALPSEKGVRFTVEESELLHNILNASTEKHPLRDGIMRKLFTNSDLRPLSQNISQTDNAFKLRQLNEAIEKRCCVILENYHSANSKTLKDRLVEPLGFGDNYENVLTYEPSSGIQKAFRLDRVGAVEVLYEQKQSNKEVSEGFDVFGLLGKENIKVKLLLNDLAYRILIESYPSTKPYTQHLKEKTTHPYTFEGDVKRFEGVGRFILGLHSGVIVKSPSSLKKYLNDILKGLKY